MKDEEKLLVVSIVLVVLFLLAFGGVSDADVSKCVEQMGWSAERCAVKLSQ